VIGSGVTISHSRACPERDGRLPRTGASRGHRRAVLRRDPDQSRSDPTRSDDERDVPPSSTIRRHPHTIPSRRSAVSSRRVILPPGQHALRRRPHGSRVRSYGGGPLSYPLTCWWPRVLLDLREAGSAAHPGGWRRSGAARTAGVPISMARSPTLRPSPRGSALPTLAAAELDRLRDAVNFDGAYRSLKLSRSWLPRSWRWAVSASSVRVDPRPGGAQPARPDRSARPAAASTFRSGLQPRS
jgi:hypothetical protein